MGFNLMQFLLIIILLISSNQIYAKAYVIKCIDKKGKVSYTSKAACDNPEKIILRKSPPSSTKKSQHQYLVNKNAARDIKKCQKFKSKLTSYKRAPFLTKVVKDELTGKSNKVRLSNDEIKEELSNIQSEINYWCNRKSK